MSPTLAKVDILVQNTARDLQVAVWCMLSSSVRPMDRLLLHTVVLASFEGNVALEEGQAASKHRRE